MIHVINEAILTTPITTLASGTAVPFDTIVLNTNGNLALSNTVIQEKVTGVYDTICQVCVQNSGSVSANVILTAYADGSPITGAFVEASIAANDYQFLTLNWPVNVIASTSGTATISWIISGGAISLINANATVFRHV